MTKAELIKLATEILPKGSENEDPNLALVGSFGSLPDTLEWFLMKFSIVDDDDEECLAEWEEYLKGKANSNSGMVYITPYETYNNVKLEVSEYVYGGLYIGVYNDEEGPIANLTINVPGYMCDENEAYIDTNNSPEALDFIREYKLGKVTKDYAISGFCTYPKVVFDMDKINEYRGEKDGFANSIDYDEEESA